MQYGNDLMAKNEKSRSGFKGSITLIVVVSLLINTVLILLNTLIVSGLFFFKQATAIYDDLNKSIVGEAISQIDSDLIKDLANTCHGVFRGIDKPKELF